jgi:zinc protease
VTLTSRRELLGGSAAAALLAGCWQRSPGPARLTDAAAPARRIDLPAVGPVVWLHVSCRAGSGSDPIGSEGLAWLAANAQRQGGTAALSPDAVGDLLQSMGTDIDVLVDQDQVSFRSRCLREDLPALAQLMGDLVLAPALNPVVVERLRASSIDTLRTAIPADTEALGQQVLDSWLFAGHPSGHPTRGRIGALAALDVATIRGHLDRCWLRGSVLLGVAGQPDDAGRSAVALLHDRLSALPARLPLDLGPRAVRPVTGRELLVVERAGSSSTGFHFGHPTSLHRAHPDWPAMALAMTALGEHRQAHGRLYQALREKRGLNYGDYAYNEVFRQESGSSRQEPGTGRLQNAFVVWLRPVEPDNAAYALRVALDQVERFVGDGLASDEFATMQTYLGRRVALWGADPGRRLGWAAEAALMDWPDPLVLLPSAVPALTRDAVNDAVRRHLRPDDLRIVAVAPDARPLLRAAGVAPASASESESVAGKGPLPVTGEESPSPPVGAGSPAEPEELRLASLPLALRSASVIPTEDIFR